MEFGETTTCSACVFKRAERTRVDTPPTGMTERTSFSPRGEYTCGTICPLAELHWLRITVTITSVVSAVTPRVWLLDFSSRLLTKIRDYKRAVLCRHGQNDSHFSLLEEKLLRGRVIKKSLFCVFTLALLSP